MSPLRILVVATKAPWPAVDGGRLVLLNTIRALAAAGHSVDLVAPCPESDERRRETAATLRPDCTPHLIATGPRSLLASAVAGLARGIPATVARHRLPEVRRKVAELLAGGDFDVVHAEQLHSLAQTEPAEAFGVPVVHRAHNVESLLWAFAAQHRGFLTRALFALEARRMSAFEARAVETATCTVALTEVDRGLLGEMVPDKTIYPIPAPFAAELPAGPAGPAGSPAVVTLVSPSWAPSRAAVNELIRDVWPGVRRRLPGAVLNVFGDADGLGRDVGVAFHRPPTDSRTAFPAGSVALVPVRHPTGVPMKALEAWSRGLPLVVDSVSAEVLDAEDGVDAMVAGNDEGWASALSRLVNEEGLWEKVVEGGRRKLIERHDPASVAEQLTRVYRRAIDSASSPST